MPKDMTFDFPVTVYGNLEKFNDTISKGRCRIFYKGGNRNGTYITDEFAEKLLSTISYAPVKGIYDKDSEDYRDHGLERTEGRIYGVVPENPNLAWETHLDEDGEEREYACVDVLLYTALYKESKDIVGKSQSMELFPNSIKGEYKIIDGRKFFVFEEGSFLGLQALGDDVEPCFEGAAFYSMYSDLKKIINQIEKYNLKQELQNGGKREMNKKLNFKVSDNQKFDFLWSLLNVNFNEANDWQVDYGICDIYDEYAVVRNYAEGIFERVFYKKNDDTDSVELTSHERCYIMDVSESEKTALKALHELNGSTYEKVDENFSNAKAEIEGLNNTVIEKDNTIAALNEEKDEKDTKIGELNTQVSTLTTERDEAQNKLSEAEANAVTLNSQLESLKTFKAQVETEEKMGVIEKYTELLAEDVIKEYTAKVDEYTADSLDKELAYQLVTNTPAIFTKTPQPAYVPKTDGASSELEDVLSKYNKN